MSEIIIINTWYAFPLNLADKLTHHFPKSFVRKVDSADDLVKTDSGITVSIALLAIEKFSKESNLEIINLKKQNPKLRLVVYVSRQGPGKVLKLLRAGCNGLISDFNDYQELIKSISMVFAGEYFLDKLYQEEFLEQYLSRLRASKSNYRLSRRELEIANVKSIILSKMGIPTVIKLIDVVS